MLCRHTPNKPNAPHFPKCTPPRQNAPHATHGVHWYQNYRYFPSSSRTSHRSRRRLLSSSLTRSVAPPPKTGASGAAPVLLCPIWGHFAFDVFFGRGDSKRAPMAREQSEQWQRERRAGGTSRQREENPPWSTIVVADFASFATTNIFVISHSLRRSSSQNRSPAEQLRFCSVPFVGILFLMCLPGRGDSNPRHPALKAGCPELTLRQPESVGTVLNDPCCLLRNTHI